MEKKNILINSKFLNKEMELKSYGHYGLTLLLFRNINTDDEDFITIVNSLEHVINIGRCKVFITDTTDNESWYDKSKQGFDSSKRHFEYNNFIEEELVPQIYNESGGAVPIITCGTFNGAFHAANSFFRRPDIFLGTIALSGYFNINEITDGYFDDNCYFNSPVHYLPNLNDNYWLSYLMSRKHIYIASGSGEGEFPNKSIEFSNILTNKGIYNNLEIWGEEWDHSPKTWAAMLKYYLDKKL